MVFTAELVTVAFGLGMIAGTLLENYFSRRKPDSSLGTPGKGEK